MKAVAVSLVCLLFSACAYTGVAQSGDKAVVTKNYIGLFNKAYVCKVGDAGLTDCQANESP